VRVGQRGSRAPLRRVHRASEPGLRSLEVDAGAHERSRIRAAEIVEREPDERGALTRGDIGW
jgi:hypothetical protein